MRRFRRSGLVVSPALSLYLLLLFGCSGDGEGDVIESQGAGAFEKVLGEGLGDLDNEATIGLASAHMPTRDWRRRW